MFKHFSYGAPFLLLVLGSCGNSDPEVNIDYSNLKQSTVSDKPLVNASSNSFERYIKNGVRLRLTTQTYPENLTLGAADDTSAPAARFSSTNVHELGVDEADRTKYDGDYLYQVEQGQYTLDGKSNNGIRILKADSQLATANYVTSIENDSDGLQAKDIYLRPDAQQLISIKKTELFNWIGVFIDADWYWQSGKTQIDLYDIANPEQPSEQWSIEIEGNLEGSRRVDNMLYLVTRYIPDIEDINYTAETDQEKRENERVILDTPMSDLLPHYQTNNGAIRPLVSANDCLVSEQVDSDEGYADIVTLSAINLDTQQVSSSHCLNLSVQGIYSSTTGFYIGGSSQNARSDSTGYTALHKFDLTGEDIIYKASASIPGYLGWRNPSFRMSEYNNDLRIITSVYSTSSGSPEHQLRVLREDGTNQLHTLSTLPNDTLTAPIGKPNEEIFAVRFSGERAYVVTFERIDPLYVIDLSDHEMPSIAGELELPGFSRYLHALSDDWLLGIGTEVNDGALGGVKVELYDIRDISNPIAKDKLVYGDTGSYTEVNNDLRSLTILTMPDQSQRLAIPILIREIDPETGYSPWKESNLYMFDIGVAPDQSRTLNFVGKLAGEMASSEISYPTHYRGTRSTIHDNAIYYLYGNQYYSAFWGDTESSSGPY